MTFAGSLLAILLGTAAAAGSDIDGASATAHWQVREMEVVRRTAPVWPAGVVDDGTEIACRASVRVRGDGVPEEVSVDGCPAPFAAETRRALSDWRWAAWDAAVERRVSFTVRFPRPVRAPERPVPAAAATPAPPPEPVRPVIPSYADAIAHGVPERDASTDGIVCSASILRNRAGQAVRAKVGACPQRFREAAERAVKEITREPARRASRQEPRTRVQEVQITFRVTSV